MGDEPPHPARLLAVEEQVGEVVALARDVLGADLVGAYLHGSATLGGLRPSSDLDVLAVSRRPATRADKERIVDGLLRLSGGVERGPRRPVELTLVVASEIRPWRFPPRRDLQYGEWLRADFLGGADEPWQATEDPDLATLITMVVRAERPLQGPPAAEVFDPVPRAHRVRAMVGGLDEMAREIGSDTRNKLLTLARIWCTVATDEIRSKDGAAEWALARLPEEHRTVLARARALYLRGEHGTWDDLQPRLRSHADHVVGEIERLAAAEREPV